MKKCCLLVVIFFQLCFAFQTFAKTTYILGVDGLSYEALQNAKKQGLFQELPHVSAHIASFPTMTDLVWSNVFQTRKIFGKAGRIRSVEAVYFDESSKKVKGDVRDYYNRLAQPKYYMNGFEYFFNPYIEALMYFPTKEMAKVEINSVIDAMLASPNTQKLVTGYIGGIDSTAHTQFERLFPVLQNLDAGLKRLVSALQKKGQEFELFIISDHGNVGNFDEGDSETPLTPIEIAPVLKNHHLQLTAKLSKSGDVAIPMMALGSWAPVYVHTPEQVKQVIHAVLSQPWFDLAVELIEDSKKEIILEVTSAEGSAQIVYEKSTQNYFYIVKTGNPLKVPSTAISTSVRRIQLKEAQIERFSRSSNYPDSLIRLVESVSDDNFDYPDLILTFKNGYYLNNSMGGMTTMYRTHGSLTRRASLGILASVSTNLPSYVRSSEIFETIKISPDQTFGKLGLEEKKATAELVEAVLNDKNGIPTGAREFSEKRIFKMITKPVAISRPFIVADEIKDILSALNLSISGFGNEQKLAVGPPKNQKFDFSNAINPNEIGELTDLAIKNPDINVLKNDPRVLQIVKRLGIMNDDSPENDLESHKDKSLAAKRIAMKIYQIPYLLDQALNFPEKTVLPETRDLNFAKYWAQNRDNASQRFDVLNKGAGTFRWDFWNKNRQEEETLAQRLFKEIFKELEIENRIAPKELTALYRTTPENTTIVYVPGTYNGIFDEEIFSSGLMAVKEDLGLRTLVAPVKSACSSDINADYLLNFLKADQIKFKKLGKPVPQYILIGYSKGAMDSLYAFVQDKKFVQENVQALIAVAAALKGSPILGKADLPYIVVNMLIDESTPKICQSEKIATSTATEQASNSFWKKHERDLVGLTRYLSVSFVSDPEESNVIMKVTKLVAQFDEENDGVVTLSSSKFPKSLMPIDLGTLRADHLAGILSSRFNQKAFMKALVKVAGELKIQDAQTSRLWRLKSLIPALTGAYQGSHEITFDLKNSFVQMIDKQSRSLMRNSETISFQDPYELNTKLLSIKKDPLSLYEAKGKLLSNQIEFDLESALNLAKLPDILSQKRVTPETLLTTKQGLDFSFNHSDVRHYRIDHQWFYENRSPLGADNNPKWGFQSVKGPDGHPWLALRSENNSIRMTTLSHRFRPAEFPILNLDLMVTKSPTGADPVFGKSGKDDSSFQLWFTFRDLSNVKERSLSEKNDSKVFTFGYYWGEPVAGEPRAAGQIFENYYSNKNVIVAQLPAAFQLLLNSDNANLGKPQSYKQDLAQDIQKAYPQLDVNKLEVIAVTIQMDSNDTKSTSEAFMKTLKLTPRNTVANDRLGMNQ